MWRYRRGAIRAPWWRIKEWDYYAVIDQARGVGVTITFSDLGYAGLIALCFVDVKHGLVRQVDTLKPLTLGKLGLAEEADAEDVKFEFDTDDYLKPWEVHSSDGRLEMVFEPTVNRAGHFNLLLI